MNGSKLVLESRATSVKSFELWLVPRGDSGIYGQGAVVSK